MIEILGKDTDNQTVIISTLKLASAPSSSSFEQGRTCWSPEVFINLYCATTKDLLNASSKKKQQELPGTFRFMDIIPQKVTATDIPGAFLTNTCILEQ